MFEQATTPAPRNAMGDWILRGCIALVFVVFGAEKFSSSPDGEWVGMFQQIGWGQWFRYFTGVVEILGGVFLLSPWTVTAGLALLGCTMASAALIVALVLGHPGDSVFPGGIFMALAAFWWSRRRR